MPALALSPATLWADSQVLEQNTAAQLDNAVASAASRYLAKGRAVHRRRRPTKIGQVEDVRCFPADLEPEVFIDVEGPEDRRVDVPVSGDVKLSRTSVPKTTQRTNARTSCCGSRDRCSRNAVGSSIEPLLFCSYARFRTVASSHLPRHNARAIVVRSIAVHIGPGGYRKRLPAVCRDNCGHRPSVQGQPDKTVVLGEVVGSPHERGIRRQGPVVGSALPVLQIRIVRINKRAVQGAVVQRIAGQRLAPDEEPAGGEVLRKLLFDGYLHAVVIRVLIGPHDVDVRVGGRRG